MRCGNSAPRAVTPFTTSGQGVLDNADHFSIPFGIAVDQRPWELEGAPTAELIPQSDRVKEASPPECSGEPTVVGSLLLFNNQYYLTCLF